LRWENMKKSTSNAEHPLTRPSADYWMLVVECSMLDVHR